MVNKIKAPKRDNFILLCLILLRLKISLKTLDSSAFEPLTMALCLERANICDAFFKALEMLSTHSHFEVHLESLFVPLFSIYESQ